MDSLAVYPPTATILTRTKSEEQMEFEKELEMLINEHSKENESDTPDFILAQYLKGCLANYEEAVKARDKWYGFKGLSERSSGI